jgi:hypothetical protein
VFQFHIESGSGPSPVGMVEAKMYFSPYFHKINTRPSAEKQYLSKLHLGLTLTTARARADFLEVSLEDLEMTALLIERSLLRLLLLLFSLATVSLVVPQLFAEDFLGGGGGAADGLNERELDERVRGTDSIELWEE